MLFDRWYGFAALLITLGICLHFIPIDEEAVMLRRVAPQATSDQSLRDVLRQNCARLALSQSLDENAYGELWLQTFKGLLRSGNQSLCFVTVKRSREHRFHLVGYWNVYLAVANSENTPLYEKNFSATIARPLTVLPFIALVLAYTFGLPWCGIIGTFLLFGFALVGFNGKHFAESSLRSVALSLFSDPNAWAVCLILFWHQFQLPQSTSQRTTGDNRRWKWKRWISVALGIWNPALMAPSERAFQRSPLNGHRIRSFLNLQVIVTALSLYLLSIDFNDLHSALSKNILIPRYLTLAVVVLSVFNPVRLSPTQALPALGSPRPWIFVVCWGCLQAVSHFVPGFGERTSPVLLFSAALVISSPLPRFPLQRRTLLRVMGLAGGWLAALSFAEQSRIIDWFLYLLDGLPFTSHTAVAAYIAGIALGFLQGIFSLSFFDVLGLASLKDSPLLRAAFLDGTLIGILYSPLSLLNLFPIAFYNISYPELIRIRSQQLGKAILIGLLVFTMSGVNSVAILQPVTFVFICLVAVSHQLKQAKWRMGGVFAPIK